MSKKEFNISEVKMDNLHDLNNLVSTLAVNGYEVQVTPVYETDDEFNKRASRYGYRKPRALITHYIVKIVGMSTKPINAGCDDRDDEEF